MPKRSNPFQKLIYLLTKSFRTGIARSLARRLKQQLGSEFEVLESEEPAHDVTGTPREIDVVIKNKGTSIILVGIECRKWKKDLQDVTWVEQAITKHKHLGVRATVLVSSTGFTKEARNLAEHYGIKLMSMTEALDEDWMEFSNGLKTLYWAAFKLTTGALYFHLKIDPNNPVRTDLDWTIFSSSGNPICTVRDVIIPELQKMMPVKMKDIEPGKEGKASFKMQLLSPVFMADIQGSLHEITGFSGEFSFEVPVRIPVPLERGHVEGIPVAFGEGHDAQSEVQIHLMKTSDGPPSAIGILKDGGVEKEIPMKWMGPPAISTPPKENLKNEGDPI
jgi:Restriction endonuclease